MHARGSTESARVVLPHVIGWIAPRSVIDVGCGTGAWASVAKELGVSAVTGVDGDYVSRADLQIDPSEFVIHDLATPLTLEGHFDLAICLEVAEHLSPDRAERFVGELVALADTVLFSAAIPGQGGTAHLNERWQSYWVQMFAEVGFDLFDVIRPLIWDDDRVAFWYRQNALVFAGAEKSRVLQGYASGVAAVDIVHPAFMSEIARREQEALGLRRLASMVGPAVAGSVRHRLSRRRH